MAKSIPEVRALTGLRGIAALYVVCLHYYIPIPENMRILSHGYLAVDLFFALSGFVLAMNYSGKLSREFTLQAYLSFLARRFARIYPLYLFTLTAATALVASHLMELHANPSRIFLPNLFMVQNWGRGRVSIRRLGPCPLRCLLISSFHSYSCSRHRGEVSAHFQFVRPALAH